MKFSGPKIFFRFFIFLLAILYSSIGVSSSSSFIQGQNPTVLTFKNSINLPLGSQIYLYGFGTGGGYPSTGFKKGQYATSTDALGNLVAALAVTTANNNSFSASASYYTIAGVGVSGFSSYSSFYGVNNQSGASFASTNVNVNTLGSLVVIIAIPGGETYVNISGIPNLQIDASSANTPGRIPVVIAHSYADVWGYTIKMITQGNPDQNPSSMGNLLGVFVFSPSSGQLSSQNNTFSNLNYELFGILGIIIFAVVIGVILVRRKMVKSKSSYSKEESLNQKELEKLKSLRDKGLITQEYYERKEKDLLKKGGK